MQRYFRRLLAGILALAGSFLGSAAKLPQALIDLSAQGSRTLRKRGLAHPQAFLLCPLSLGPLSLGLDRGLHADLAFNDAAFFRKQIGRDNLTF